MADMLVNLVNLPDEPELFESLKEQGINIRRIMPYEISFLREFVSTFSKYWADEVMNAFAHQPATCFIATHNRKIIGFGAYECTNRNYFGPTGVHPDFRGKGIGKALLLACMKAMREYGYAYAIIGSVGPADFYAKCIGATAIPDSTPGIYQDILRND